MVRAVDGAKRLCSLPVLSGGGCFLARIDLYKNLSQRGVSSNVFELFARTDLTSDIIVCMWDLFEANHCK